MERLSFIRIFFGLCLSLFSNSIQGQKITKPTKNKTVRSVLPKPEPDVVEDWQEFVREDLKIKISFPNKPETTAGNELEYSPKGAVSVKVTNLQTYVNKTFYMVSIRTYPKDFLPQSDNLAENVAEWLKHDVLRRVEIVGEREIKYGRYTMIEFVYRPTKGELIVHRSVVIGNQMFQLIVQFPISKTMLPAQAIQQKLEKINKFCNSFHVTEDKIVDPTVG